MRIQTIYSSYQGEVNKRGIGAPVIFVRTGGCHLRCYKETLGVLCDTPEALEKSSGAEMTMDEIFDKVDNLSRNEGFIRYICLTGGDPLWRKPSELTDFFIESAKRGYEVSVETSGTLSIEKFYLYPNVSWVLDYKSISAGVKQEFVWENLDYLSQEDFIKFVIYDYKDLDEMAEMVPLLKDKTKAQIAVGLYWGGPVKSHILVAFLKAKGLLGQVVINMQSHKLLTHYDITSVKNTFIPTEL